MKDLDDKRSITTLLQKDSPIKSLRGLCVLALVKGSDIVQIKLKPIATNQGSQLWNDHVYNCAQDLIPAKTPIDKWVSEITDPNEQMNAFRPEPAVELQQSTDVGIVYKEPLSSTKKSITKRTRTARGNPDASNKAFIAFQSGHDGKEAATQEKMASFSDHQSIEDVSKGKESHSHRQPPSIEPPYMPPSAMPSRSLSTTPSVTSQQLMLSSSTWNAVVRDNKSDNLIDISVPNERRASDKKSEDETMIVIDNLQDTIKAKTRDLKYTMNQRKAPTQALVQGNTALIKNFEETTLRLLALVVSRTGRIDFTVDIGRLLIHQQRGSSEFKNKSFKTSDFSSVLPKGRTTGFEPMFTNMLTARSSEAESIVNVLLSQGRRLFQQQPISRTVTYVFSCKAKGGDQIVVKLDENGDFKVSLLTSSHCITTY